MTETKEKKPRGPAKTFADKVCEAREVQVRKVEKLVQRVMEARNSLDAHEAALANEQAELKRMDAMLGMKS